MMISMSYDKFKDIDDNIEELSKLSKYMSHNDLFYKIKNMDDKELIMLAATINELTYDWDSLKGIKYE